MEKWGNNNSVTTDSNTSYDADSSETQPKSTFEKTMEKWGTNNKAGKIQTVKSTLYAY